MLPESADCVSVSGLRESHTEKKKHGLLKCCKWGLKTHPLSHRVWLKVYVCVRVFVYSPQIHVGVCVFCSKVISRWTYALCSFYAAISTRKINICIYCWSVVYFSSYQTDCGMNERIFYFHFKPLKWSIPHGMTWQLITPHVNKAVDIHVPKKNIVCYFMLFLKQQNDGCLRNTM